MERELVLGIDYGGKYTGLAVVDRRNNQVLYAHRVEMRDDIADMLKKRRAQRSIRRTGQTKKKRLRELKSYLKSIGHDKSTEVFKAVYSLCHKRGYDYADMPEEKTPEEIEAMDVEERKQWEDEKKEWEETKRNSRHREEVLKDVREAMAKGGTTEEQIKSVERIFNKQYRPKRFNNRILTKCKVEGCGKNTPRRKNVRNLLLRDKIRWLPITEDEQKNLEIALLDKNKEDVDEMFKRYKINSEIRKQLRDIAYNEKLSGSTVFCKDHILEHTEHTKEERKVFRLAPSLKTKIENVLAVIKDEILPKFTINRVIMESNNFDIEVKTKGKKKVASNDSKNDDSNEKNQSGGTKLSLKERLIEETDGKCVYCGTPIDKSNTEIDHIFPTSAGGLNIYANLVASCKSCNGIKKGRTPQECGKLPKPEIIQIIKKNLKPKVVKRKIGGVTRNLVLYDDLKVKILEDATNIKTLDFNKYMSHASIGWRHMRDRLKELTGNEKLPIERQSGIYTAYFRKWWGFKKERANTLHHALDAVILASRKGYNDESLVDMTLKPRYKNGDEFDPEKHLPDMVPSKRDKGSRGSPLHDRNPLSYNKKNGAITRRFMVTEIECGKEDAVVSDEYREKLTEAFKRFNKKKSQGNKRGDCLTDEEAKLGGFWLERNDGRERDKVMSLKCKVVGTGEPQLIEIENNVFKTNVHNVGVAVYVDEKGKRTTHELKNPRLIKHFVKTQPPISGRKLFVLRRGDFVKYEGEDTIYRIKKLGESPALEAVIKGDDDNTRKSAKASKLIKISDKNIPSKY